MTSSAPAPAFDLIGVGSPIMDLVATVPEEFLGQVRGAKGGMVLVDDDELARILALLGADPAHATGGSAANVTFNASRLGLRSTFLGKLGNCAIAQRYRHQFEAVGVDPSRFKQGDRANARCLALITPDAQRTMRTNLGAALTLAPEEISAADFAGCRHAHIEGYLAFNPALADAALTAARAAGASVSLDLSSFEVVHASRDWLFSQFRRGIDIVFANEDEIRALFPTRTAVPFADLATELARHGVLAAVKVGSEGAWIAHGNERYQIDPVRVPDVRDTNGAGDAWAAGFLYGHLHGLGLPDAGRIASVLGGETVRHLGPIIPPAHWPSVHAQAESHRESARSRASAPPSP
ncbi:MAG: adenosine kinase [Verrucomicrobia bacterium]|nr:adenosine kinase [Verrucomicrobiota bacterium]